MKEENKLLFSMVACIIIVSLALPLGDAIVAQADAVPGDVLTVSGDSEPLDGFWLDSITIEKEPDRARGVERLAAGDFDVYAVTLTDPSLFAIVDANPNLRYESSIGSFNTMRVNPYGPLFTDGTLNPFHYPEMIEALHKFIDRDFIANDVMGGLAWPRYTSQHTQLSDHARYFDDTYVSKESSIQFLQDKYDYDEAVGMQWLADAIAVINADPDVPGTVALEGGKFLYNGEQVEMVILIRSDDSIRDQIGDYIGAQLEKMGFKYTPFKGDMAATLSGKANVKTEIEGGGWNMYTGGWVSTVLSRDSGYWFLYFHTNFWSGGIPAFASLEVPDDYFDAAMALAWLDFSSFAERDAAYELCLPEHMKYGMVHLVDSRGFSPLRSNLCLAADKAGGIYGSWMWAFTAHFRDAQGNPQFGGDMRIAMHDLLVEPWNPIAGSNTVYDMFPIRATCDMGTQPDTNDGLRWAGRIDSAEVTVTTGLPVIATNPWVELKFAPTITAPGDAWRSWDPATQTPRTVAQALANPDEPWGLSDAGVARYSVAYYPADIWDHPLHDGSTLSFADFLYGWLMGYERGQEASPLFDEAARSTLVNSLYPNTVGYRFTVNPSPGVGLKVEEWSQLWELDAERMIATGYPNYAQGNGFWHTIALGVLEERAGNMAFGETKAQGTSLGWISFLNRDVQLGAFSSRLNAIRAATTYTDANVPFYDFIKAQYAAQGAGNFDAEIGSRADNLRGWVDTMNHLWVGSGPYYLDNYNFALSWVRLKPFEAYPDARDRWLFLAPCAVEPADEYNLHISSTSGGSVTEPGEGTLAYGAGAVVNLVATPELGYRFVNWAGDVDTIADIFAAETTITVEADSQITARFARVLASKTETVVGSGIVDAKDEADTEVEVSGTATVIVTVDRYAGDPGSDSVTSFDTFSGTSSADLLPLDKYIDVKVTEDPTYTDGVLTMIEVKLFYYADDVTSSGIDEETLVLQWYDGSKWVKCDETDVEPGSIDGYDGYVWAIIRDGTKPSLIDLRGTPFGGYGSSPGVPQGFCAIATAVYGSDTAAEIEILREFRDVVLLPNSPGSALVSIYYRTSPPVADFISRYEILRAAVRLGVVDPIVAVLNWSQAWWSVTGS